MGKFTPADPNLSGAFVPTALRRVAARWECQSSTYHARLMLMVSEIRYRG